MRMAGRWFLRWATMFTTEIRAHGGHENAVCNALQIGGGRTAKRYVLITKGEGSAKKQGRRPEQRSQKEENGWFLRGRTYAHSLVVRRGGHYQVTRVAKLASWSSWAGPKVCRMGLLWR